MMEIKLNYFDLSNDPVNSNIVIFQKNLSADFDSLAIAWKVIKNCGRGNNHPFTFPLELSVSAGDSFGNYSPQMKAENGQLFQMTLNPSGNELALGGRATSAKEIQLLNNLPKGAISANVYRGKKLLATKSAIAPAQKAVFEFKPSIFIGVASQIEEGDVLNSAVLSSVYTEISLHGIAQADIIMTGGGGGADATPFQFRLDSVKLV